MEEESNNLEFDLMNEIKNTESRLEEIKESFETMYRTIIKPYTTDYPQVLDNLTDGEYKFTQFMKANSPAYKWFKDHLKMLYRERARLNDNLNIWM